MEKFTQWLDEVLPRQERLTKISKNLVGKLLEGKNIDFLNVTGRTKTKNTALEKIDRKKYSKPELSLTDLSGVRIIVYFENQISQVSELIRESFEVDESNSMDSDKILVVGF